MYLNASVFEYTTTEAEGLTLTWDVFKYGNGKLQITNEDV